ncbi:MAG: acyl-CoA carboxylase subunit beta [Dehalococcoidia bacterium]|nr:MAG: acyl-CoA carboxylase subunit beta [Dehalococcoidia bacterium]
MLTMEKASAKAKLKKLASLKNHAQLGGGAKRIAQQRALGKITARERLDLLLDEGSFEELGTFITHRSTDFGLDEKEFLGDAVVTGSGKINGRLVFVFSQDFTVLGGSISEVVGQKVKQIMQMALDNLVPVIAIFDSGGARIQEGVWSLSAVGEMLLHNMLCSGVIPQISVMVGPSAGGAVYCPAITDYIFMVKGISQMYITGPDVVRAVTHEKLSHQELGGAEIHARKSGVAHFTHDNEKECFKAVRRLLGFLPQSWQEKPQLVKSKDNIRRTDENLRKLVPDDPKKAYDMKVLITSITDDGDFMEVQQEFARSIMVGFGRMGGRSVGIVAQQPAFMAGVIDIDSSDKAARFVRFCDAFNIPLVSLVDVPGFMPGSAQEYGGIIRHGAKLIYAYAEATVPKVTVITRKAYGGAYIVMSSKHLRGDINFAWPTAEIAVMGAEGAVNIISKKFIASSDKPKETRQKLVSEYEERFSNPYFAAARGYIDDVIDPAETRPKLIRALETLANKVDTNPTRKHGNIPL